MTLLLAAPPPRLLLPAVCPVRPALALDTVVCADALTFLRGLPDASVDAVITDPPYGIGYESSWTTRNDGSPRIADRSFGADAFDGGWLTEAARILRHGGAVYVFTRWDTAHRWREALLTAGLTVAQRIVWDKSHWGMGDLRYFGSQTEDILFAVKGEHRLNWRCREGNLWNIWKGRVWADVYTGHPTPKPVDLMAKMIGYSTDPGGVVCDPFIGSGTTCVAAKHLGRHYVGCDIQDKYVEIARRRLAQPFTPPLLPLDPPAPRAEQRALFES